MSLSDDNRARYRPATMSSLAAGAGIALFGIVFASFVIYIQFRSGFDLPQILIGLVGTGLLILVGVWVLVRPSRLSLILAGSILLLYGGFILSAILFSSSEQPFWLLPVGIGLIGLSVLSFKDSIAAPSLPLAPAKPASTPPPQAGKPVADASPAVRRRWYQLRLGPAVVFSVIGMLLLVLNLIPRTLDHVGEVYPGAGVQPTVIEFGIPVPAIAYVYAEKTSATFDPGFGGARPSQVTIEYVTPGPKLMWRASSPQAVTFEDGSQTNISIAGMLMDLVLIIVVVVATFASCKWWTNRHIQLPK